MARHPILLTLPEDPITLVDLDAAGIDLTEPIPPEFLAFLDEQSANGYVTLWSAQFADERLRSIWQWLYAADDERRNQFRLKLQFVEPPADKPSGGHVTELTYPPAPSFVGVLDLVDFSGAFFAYGHRAMSTAMLGQPVYRLVRDSDSAELDVLSDPVTGEIDVAAVIAWAGGVCRLHTWYDQTGVESHLLDIGGSFVKAPWAAAALNGKPAFIQGTGLGSGVNTYAPTAYACNFPDTGGQGTAFMLARGPILLNARNVSGAGYFNFRGGASAIIDTSSDGSNLNGAGGDYTGLIPNTNWVLVDCSVEFGDNDYYYNGTLLPENRTNDVAAVPLNPGMQPRIGWSGATTGYGIQEVFCCPGIIDPDQRLAARQNMAAWAGITLP